VLTAFQDVHYLSSDEGGIAEWLSFQSGQRASDEGRLPVQ